MEYLYHYTTLPSLVSMISKNQLRMLRLDKFLNLYDADFPTYIDFCGLDERLKDLYVSSWIDDQKETISKWKLFSNLENGVRIRINTQHIFDENGICEVNRVIPYSSIFFKDTFFQAKELINKVCMTKIQQKEEQERYKIVNFNIEEVDAESEREQRILIDTLFSASFNPMTSQNEVRLQVKTLRSMRPYKKNELREYEQKLKSDDNLHYIMVSLPDNFFKDIEVLVSPNFSEENLQMLQSFLSKQGITYQIQESKYKKILSSYSLYLSLYNFN